MSRYSVEALTETARWATGLPGANIERSPQEEKAYLRWLTERVLQEQTQVEIFFQNHSSEQLTSLTPYSWFLQKDTYGMKTCQIASAINALCFLELYNSRLHTEEAIIDAISIVWSADGPTFARRFPKGLKVQHLVSVFNRIAPDAKLRRSNSVAEMLSAAYSGAAVMTPVNGSHEVLIPPGFHIRKGSEDLEVQVADPLFSNARFIPVNQLIRSEITTVSDRNLGHDENNVLIIERAPLGSPQPQP
ncbi:hypothetical protein HYU96_00195 [Candidatus Daviesbacteria bacterium]|nr:hypothetical protein [Candidatus Daviesbacteria bacterium]